MNFLHRVIVIPEKLTALAAAGLVFLIVKFELWLVAVTGIDFSGVLVPLAVGLAAVLAMVVKVVLEKVVPENWHEYVNSFLAWLATVVIASFLLQA